MSHTPGPWEWTRPLSEDQWTLRNGDWKDVLQANGGGSYDDGHYIDGSVDDLRLIAAAPELLAACKHILGAASYDDMDFRILSDVIAKAEGKP